jgi:hypothetical protein
VAVNKELSYITGVIETTVGESVGLTAIVMGLLFGDWRMMIAGIIVEKILRFRGMEMFRKAKI